MKIKKILVRRDVVDVGSSAGGTCSVTWDVVLRFGREENVIAWRYNKSGAIRFARAFAAGVVESVTSVKPNLKATETIAIIDSMIEVVE